MSISPNRPGPARRTASVRVTLARLIALTGLGSLLLALLLALSLLILQIALQDRIAPGLLVGELDLGGMTESEARKALRQRYAGLDADSYVLSAGDLSWLASASELGLRLAEDATLRSAFAIGRGGDLISSLEGQAAAWFGRQSIAPLFTFDENIALAYLHELAGSIDRDRQDASLRIESLMAKVDPGISGRVLDIDLALVRLKATILAAAGGEIALPVMESQPRRWNVQELAKRVNLALSTPLQLTATDAQNRPLAPWTIRPEQIRSLLQVTLSGQGDEKRFDLRVNMAAFGDFLRSLAPSLMILPREGRFDFDPHSGALIPLRHGSPGRELNVAATLAKLEEAVFSPEARVVPMVFERRPPRYHAGVSAAELGITELVASGTSYFWGSWQNRRHNIELGARKLHGIMVGPGEEFSFNQSLGGISAGAGFVDSAIILGGRTVAGIGGGICQVSTTLYRAAFSGGYAISERHSHGYRVAYYEYAGAGPGLDAAIWQPGKDLRFINDTPHHLVIESEFDSARDALHFRIYSARHRHTELEAPIIRDILPPPPPQYVANPELASGQIRQVEYPVPGADVWVYRNIRDQRGNLIKRDAVYTRYAPWRAIFEVAPDDARLEDESVGEAD